MSSPVVHFEIPADDLDRAREFYRSAFAWDVTSMPDLDYTILTTTATDDQGQPTEPGGINGGMFRREQPLTSPVVTIAVTDIDAALAQVEASGGTTVFGRQPVAEMGFTAYFRDTEGNLMGLWQNAGPMG